MVLVRLNGQVNDIEALELAKKLEELEARIQAQARAQIQAGAKAQTQTDLLPQWI